MKEIDLNTLKVWEEDNRSFQLIDVREPEEHQAFNIGGKLLPLGEIVKRIEDIPEDVPVVFYCKRGIRSQIAIQRLSRFRENADFYNLRGGILHLKR